MKRRSGHVVQLNPLELKGFIAELMGNKEIPEAAKQAVAAIVAVAANPNAERVDVVIDTLPEEYKANVNATARQVRRLERGVTTRGRDALQAMSDAEWEELLSEA